MDKEEIKKAFYRKFGKNTIVVKDKVLGNPELVEPIVAVWHFFEPFIRTKEQFITEEYAEGYNKAVEDLSTKESESE